MKHFNYQTRTLIVGLLVLAAGMATAAPRSVKQAQQEALQVANKRAASMARGQQPGVVVEPRLVFTKTKKDASAYYYIFSTGQDRGFTVVSGDDRLPAVIGYTESGNYDADRLPANFVSFMQAYQDYVDHATDTELESVSAWRTASSPRQAVEPLVTSTWSQDSPFNDQCPVFMETMRCVAGCVATAMAQILYYHKSPVSLLADIPAYKTYSYQMPLDTIKAGETYDWANMLDHYAGGETAEQRSAVAKLLLHVGCAVQMDYGPIASGTAASAEAFVKYFGMDKELTRRVQRAWYGIEAWDEMLYREMAEGRPVCYEGQSTGGGHAFVVHGYRDGLYCVNWGWGGMCDGYFDITILNPNNSSGIGASSSDDGYSMDNGMIIGIQPDNGVVDEVSTALLMSYSDLKLDGEATVSGNTVAGTVVASPGNVNMTKDSVYYSVGYQTDGGYTTLAEVFNVTAKDMKVNQYYPNKKIGFNFQYEEGKTYKLYLIESLDGKNWQPTLNAETTTMNLTVQNGTATAATAQYVLSATAQLDSVNSSGYANMGNTIDVTVSNGGDKEYYNRVYIYVSDNDSMAGRQLAYATGITVAPEGSTTFNFAYTPQAPGRYYFTVVDTDSREIGRNSIAFEASPAPQLSLVSVTCDNASEDKAIAIFQGYGTEMNVVYDTKADFTFTIRNVGGAHEGPFKFLKYDAARRGWAAYEETLTIPADTTVSFTYTAEGNYGDVVGMWIEKSANSDVAIKGMTEPNVHVSYEPDGAVTYAYPFAEIAYLSEPQADDDSTDVGITAAEATALAVTVGEGTITLKASRAADVRIVAVSGAQAARVLLSAGEQKTVSLPAGVYLVNRKKVIVR